MEWAVDYSGEHIRAGSRDSEKPFLRCPVCKTRVYHRNGSSRRAHFAHYSGNSNQECELYYPGVAVASFETRSDPRHEILIKTEIPSLGSPALVWRDGEPIPISLMLRLPQATDGYPSTLSVNSPLGHRKLNGSSLAKVHFVPVALQTPPAEIETNPRDPKMEARLREVIWNFKSEGNFFRAHIDGGILNNQEIALELGETYFLVTQRSLSPSQPNSLEILQTRVDRSWTVYRLHLRDCPESRKQDITELRAYLKRDISLPRPKIDILWPLPSMLDPDGSYIYGKSIGQLIVRSNAGQPIYVAPRAYTSEIISLENNLYSISFDSQADEALVCLQDGGYLRIRFRDDDLIEPQGVNWKSGNMFLGLHTSSSVEIPHHNEKIIVNVPTERLWKRVRADKTPLLPLPSQRTHELAAPINELDFGAFGRLLISRPPSVISQNVPWHKNIESLIVRSAGKLAWKQLGDIHTKGQLLSWATRYRAHFILPLMLSTFSAEVDRGLPRCKQ